MTRLLTAMTALMLSGCVTACGPALGPNRSIDSSLSPLLDKFHQYAQLYRITIPSYREDNLILRFASTSLIPSGSPNTTTIGTCTIGTVGPDGAYIFVVSIDPDFYFKADPSTRESLVFHELGHCLLNEGHRSERDENNKPKSLMNPDCVHGEIYNASEDVRNEYLKELFEHAEF